MIVEIIYWQEDSNGLPGTHATSAIVRATLLLFGSTKRLFKHIFSKKE